SRMRHGTWERRHGHGPGRWSPVRHASSVGIGARSRLWRGPEPDPELGPALAWAPSLAPGPEHGPWLALGWGMGLRQEVGWGRGRESEAAAVLWSATDVPASKRRRRPLGRLARGLRAYSTGVA